MPTNQAVPEPEGHVFESIEAFLLAMRDSADAEVANAARTALARMPGQGAAAASEDGHGIRRRSRRQETVTSPVAATSHDVNAADRLGWTVLMRAAHVGHTDRVSALLAAPGLNVNATNRDGHTALMLAAGRGHAETVTALLAAPGLDVNAADSYGWTVLMWAVNGGHAESVRALLAYPGVDVNATDRNGRTARALAKAGGNGKIASLLRPPGTNDTCCIIT